MYTVRRRSHTDHKQSHIFTDSLLLLLQLRDAVPHILKLLPYTHLCFGTAQTHIISIYEQQCMPAHCPARLILITGQVKVYNTYSIREHTWYYTNTITTREKVMGINA